MESRAPSLTFLRPVNIENHPDMMRGICWVTVSGCRKTSQRRSSERTEERRGWRPSDRVTEQACADCLLPFGHSPASTALALATHRRCHRVSGSKGEALGMVAD